MIKQGNLGKAVYGLVGSTIISVVFQPILVTLKLDTLERRRRCLLSRLEILSFSPSLNSFLTLVTRRLPSVHDILASFKCVFHYDLFFIR
jgi:Cu/Ag efflux pump CusA